MDLLQIQQDIHPGIFAVMDGTFSGDGPGPRAMRWHETDVLLASADQVAIDATSARLQGFDPLSLPFIRLAHEKEMGIGDPKQIEILGEPIVSGEAIAVPVRYTYPVEGPYVGFDVFIAEAQPGGGLLIFGGWHWWWPFVAAVIAVAVGFLVVWLLYRG